MKMKATNRANSPKTYRVMKFSPKTIGECSTSV